MTTTLLGSKAGLALRPLHPAFGAEVTGIDLGAPLNAPVIEVLHDALLENGVLLLRGQSAPPDALARGLAMLESPRPRQGGETAATALDPLPAGRGSVPLWQADRSYAAEPTLAVVMRAATGAGEIAFADQRAALDRLPLPLRARLDGLRAVHRHPRDPAERAEHPLVRRHPVTGDASLYVSPAFTSRILNLPEGESRRLIAMLGDAATSEDLVWRHAWAADDVLVWDCRRLLHAVSGNANGACLRIGGDRPVASTAHVMPWVSAG